MDKRTKADYQVFMLRIWQEPKQPGSESTITRLSIENTKTGKRIGFADWDQLMDFLQKNFGEVTLKRPEME